jgi:hypothetical protein
MKQRIFLLSRCVDKNELFCFLQICQILNFATPNSAAAKLLCVRILLVREREENERKQNLKPTKNHFRVVVVG